jgi:hypothetical protein
MGPVVPALSTLTQNWSARGVHKLSRVPDPIDFQEDRISAPHGFRELELTFYLAVALLELAELTGDEDAHAEAQAIFEHLGAQPWLERISAARTTSAISA